MRVPRVWVPIFCLMLGSCNQQVAAVSDDANVLQYEDAWIREAPPGMSMMAGYLNIRNNGDKNVAIVSATSDAFMDIEMHKTEITDKTARMVEQKCLLIPKGGEMELSPGGFHLMLMMPIKPLKEGDKVDIKFKVPDRGSVNPTPSGGQGLVVCSGCAEL